MYWERERLDDGAVQYNGLELKCTQNHVNRNYFLHTEALRRRRRRRRYHRREKFHVCYLVSSCRLGPLSEGVKTRSCMYSVNVSVWNAERNKYARLKSTRTQNKMWIISCQSSVEPIFFDWPWLKSVCLCAKRSFFLTLDLSAFFPQPRCTCTILYVFGYGKHLLE